jgi:hypothetical protein
MMTLGLGTAPCAALANDSTEYIDATCEYRPFTVAENYYMDGQAKCAVLQITFDERLNVPVTGS